MSGPGRIHIIDDDGPMRESTACLLQAFGMQTLEWESPTRFLAEAVYR